MAIPEIRKRVPRQRGETPQPFHKKDAQLEAINPENKCGMPCLPLAHNTVPGSYFPDLTPQLNFMQTSTLWPPERLKATADANHDGRLAIWFYLDLQTRESIVKCRSILGTFVI